MMIGHVDGATRICGKAQGYLGLPLRDELITCTVSGEATLAMVTAWQPTPEELEALNCGASVHVRILGTTPPPMMVDVGPAPDTPPLLNRPALDRTVIAKAIYDTSTKWLINGGMPAHLLCSFENLGERDRNLHLAYADAVLALPAPGEAKGGE